MASEPILRLEEHDKVMSRALLSLPMLLMQADTLQADDSEITTASSDHVDQIIFFSISAILSGVIGIHYGHVLIQFKGHAERLNQWVTIALGLLVIAIVL
ncbi:hypothetical protein Tco_0693775 [Tanacetum coccineum]